MRPYSKLPYDPVRDFIAVSQFSTTGMLIAEPPAGRFDPGPRGVREKPSGQAERRDRRRHRRARWQRAVVPVEGQAHERALQRQRAFDARDRFGEADVALLTPLAIQTHSTLGQAEGLRRHEQGAPPVLPEVPTLAEQGVTAMTFRTGMAFVAARTPDGIVRRCTAPW